MDKFTASNGISVQRNPDDGPDCDYQSWMIGNAREVLLAPHEIDALREFFQHERDQELGRWRWPENPDYVVYPDGTSRTVVEESNGRTMIVSLHDRKAMTTYLASYVGAARAYDAAHPEPKPWHDAKPGEVWLVTCCEGVYKDVPAIVDGGKFHFQNLVEVTDGPDSIDVNGADFGLRIWPESSDE